MEQKKLNARTSIRLAKAPAPLELPYATKRDGKISSLAMLFSIDLISTMVSKQRSHFQQCQI
jgi:hypothetical protein